MPCLRIVIVPEKGAVHGNDAFRSQGIAHQLRDEFPAKVRSEKNFRAVSMSRAICARNSSGPENFLSSRILE
jgi:hypothetical protein